MSDHQDRDHPTPLGAPVVRKAVPLTPVKNRPGWFVTARGVEFYVDLASAGRPVLPDAKGGKNAIA